MMMFFGAIGGTNHDDVLRRNFIPQLLGDLLSPPPIPKGNGHRSFGLVLSYDIFVEFGNNLAWSKGLHRLNLLKVCTA
jgi:hypothetical protein